MVMTLEQHMVDEIAAIGKLRLPNEACGVLLPYPLKGQQVIEIPNRADFPLDSFTMLGNDIELELNMHIESRVTEEQVRDILVNITFWHTHPKGNVGPSREDMRDKPPFGKSLVVSLGDPPLATWF